MIVLGFPVLLIVVAVPLIASVLFPLLGRKLGPKTLAGISAVVLIIPALVTISYLFEPRFAGGFIDPPYFSHSSIGTFSMLLDPLNAPLVFSLGIVTSAVAIYSLPYMRHRMEEMVEEGAQPPSWGTYFMLFTMFSAAMLGMMLSTNLVEFYIFLELALIPSFFLIILYGYGNRTRIAILYLLWTHISGVLFLLGMLAFGSSVGTFDIVNVQTLTFNLGLGDSLPVIVMLLMTTGLFIKMAVFGAHIWLPYAHAEAPTPVSALLSPVLVGISGYALIRIIITLFPVAFQSLSSYFLVWGLVTMIYGGLIALRQDDLKRFLAYSTVAHMGLLLLGISSLTAFGLTGAIMHYSSHAIGKSILFMVAGVFIIQFKSRSIKMMGGFAKITPKIAALSLIGFMSLSGIPPTIGLWSKLSVVIGTVEGSMVKFSAAVFICILIAMGVALTISVVYSFVTMRRIFFGRTPEGFKNASHEVDSKLIYAIAAIAVVGVLLFFFAGKFIDPLMEFLRNTYPMLS